jgi:hypothetical protein
MHIPQTPNNLPKHHPCVILQQCGPPISLQYVEERTSGTIERDEEICIGGMHSREERKNVFVAKR